MVYDGSTLGDNLAGNNLVMAGALIGGPQIQSISGTLLPG